MKNRKIDNVNRLIQYSALATCILQTNNLESEVVYTDLDPGYYGIGNSGYTIDFDNDGTPEFAVHGLSNSGVWWGTYLVRVEGLTSGAFIQMGSSITTYVAALNFDSVISSGKDWQNGLLTMVHAWKSAPSGSSGWFSTYGYWNSEIDKYLGLKFQSDGATHYGWARLNVYELSNLDTLRVYVKDFAFQDLSETTIRAGEGQMLNTNAVNIELLADISDNGNGSDLRLTFHTADDETALSGYRCMFVKVADTLDFDLAAAQLVSPPNYIDFPTTGGAYGQAILGVTTTTDINGELITPGIPYVAYMLSIANGAGTTDKLSAASNEVVLNPADLNTYYADADGDTYGDADISINVEGGAPADYVENNFDCDDTDSAINPGVTEVCNGVDDNCDSNIDEGVQITYYADADGDTYGDASSTAMACSAPEGFVADAADCDDADASVNPGAAEVLNGKDDDCDDLIDEELVSIADLNANGVAIAIYPVPANSYVTIEIMSLLNGNKASLEIFNTAGQAVYAEQLVLSTTTLIKQINFESLSSGLYMVKLTSGETVINGQIVVQH